MSGGVLVTGGTGFLGSHLVRALVRDGARVSVLVRNEAKLDGLGDIRVSYCGGDVTNLESLESACKSIDPETIFHLAADTSGRKFEGDWAQAERSLQINFIGTMNLIRAAATCGSNVRCVVRTGGLEEYGAGPGPPDEAQRECPNSP